MSGDLRLVCRRIHSEDSKQCDNDGKQKQPSKESVEHIGRQNPSFTQLFAFFLFRNVVRQNLDGFRFRGWQDNFLLSSFCRRRTKNAIEYVTA